MKEIKRKKMLRHPLPSKIVLLTAILVWWSLNSACSAPTRDDQLPQAIPPGASLDAAPENGPGDNSLVNYHPLVEYIVTKSPYDSHLLSEPHVVRSAEQNEALRRFSQTPGKPYVDEGAPGGHSDAETLPKAGSSQVTSSLRPELAVRESYRDPHLKHSTAELSEHSMIATHPPPPALTIGQEQENSSNYHSVNYDEETIFEEVRSPYIVHDSVSLDQPLHATHENVNNALVQLPHHLIPVPHKQFQHGHLLPQEYAKNKVKVMKRSFPLAHEYHSNVVEKKQRDYSVVHEHPSTELKEETNKFNEMVINLTTSLPYYKDPELPVYQEPGATHHRQTKRSNAPPEQIDFPSKAHLVALYEIEDPVGFSFQKMAPKNITEKKSEFLLKNYFRLDWDSNSLPLQQTYTVREPLEFMQNVVSANVFSREFFETIYVPDTSTDLESPYVILDDDIDIKKCNPCNNRYNVDTYPSKNDWFERFVECGKKIYCPNLQRGIVKPCSPYTPSLNLCNPCWREQKLVKTFNPESKFNEIRLTYASIKSKYQTFFDDQNNRFEIVSLLDKNEEYDHCHGDEFPAGYDLREMYRYY